MIHFTEKDAIIENDGAIANILTKFDWLNDLKTLEFAEMITCFPWNKVFKNGPS